MSDDRAVTRALHVFSTFAVGGPQRRFATLAEACGETFAHHVVATDGNFDCARMVAHPDRVKYYTLAVAKGRLPVPGNLHRFRRLTRSLEADVLVTYNWGAIEAALANRFWPVARHVHVEDGFGPEEAAGRQLRRRVLMRRLALSGRTRILVPSRTLERVATETWGFDPRRVRWIPNGIDCQQLDASAAAVAGARPPGEKPVVGTIATLRPEKNLGGLLKAFLRVADQADGLVIAGDGPERAALQAEAGRLGLADRVSFIGHVDPAALFGRIDVFALSSDTEQMPYSVIEAMACGLPVAATDVGDLRAMLGTDNARYLVPPGHPDRLAAAIGDLLASPGTRAALGRSNRARALSVFDLTEMVAGWRAALTGMDPGG